MLLLPFFVLLTCSVGSTQRTIPVSSSCTASSCRSNIQKAIDECATTHEQCIVQLDEGTYSLEYPGTSRPLLSVFMSKNTELQGHPGKTTLMVSQRHEAVINVDTCENVYIHGLVIDMPRAPYTLCTVVTSTDQSTTCKYDTTKYPFSPSNSAYSWLYVIQAILEYDPMTNLPTVDGIDIYALTNSFAIDKASVKNGEFTFNKGKFGVGKQYILRHQVYGNNGISLSNSKNVGATHVTMLLLPGMGFLTGHVHNLVIANNQIRKKPGFPMSINADGSHYGDSRGGIVRIENNHFEGQGDDGMNINTRYQGIHTISTDRKTVSVHGRAQAPQPLTGMVGDTYLIYSRHTFDLLGSIRVAVIDRDNATFETALPSTVGIYDLLLDRNNSVDWGIIRNNTFCCNRARGALLKQSNLYIEGNTFKDTTGPGVQVFPDGVHWYEGETTYNWTLKNNTFDNNNYATARQESDVYIAAEVPDFNSKGVPSYSNGHPAQAIDFKQLIIEDNTFVQTQGEEAIAIWGAVNSRVQRNHIIQKGSKKANTNIKCTGCTRNDTLNPNTCVPGPCKYAKLEYSDSPSIYSHTDRY